jgi:hypothetical protein
MPNSALSICSASPYAEAILAPTYLRWEAAAQSIANRALTPAEQQEFLSGNR